MAYVYTHTRKDTNQIFYIGIGTSPNFGRAKEKTNRNKYWTRVAAKTKWRYDIVVSSCSLDIAKEIEISLIHKFKQLKYPLTNLTSGGDVNCGFKMSKKHRKKIASVMKERVWTPELRKKMSDLAANKRKVVDQNTGKVYPSLSTAAKDFKVSLTSLHRWLTKEPKHNPTTLKLAK